jgi:hypothetical protein
MERIASLAETQVDVQGGKQEEFEISYFDV